MVTSCLLLAHAATLRSGGLPSANWRQVASDRQRQEVALEGFARKDSCSCVQISLGSIFVFAICRAELVSKVRSGSRRPGMFFPDGHVSFWWTPKMGRCPFGFPSQPRERGTLKNRNRTLIWLVDVQLGCWCVGVLVWCYLGFCFARLGPTQFQIKFFVAYL